MDENLADLLSSEEPTVRYRTRTEVLKQPPESQPLVELRAQIADSERVARLLSERDASGRIPGHPYAKWTGAHWVLFTLADIKHPPGDESLIPLREQVYAWLLSDGYRDSKPVIDGRMRMHASMEGNAIYSLLCLGLADERTEILVHQLLQAQWPDGGWNCDKRRAASHSTFMESLIPLRALALHARLTGSERSRAAAERAAEVFLDRNLYRGRRSGKVIHAEFIKLHYPCYWHYDILFGLKVITEAGFLSDPRCQPALELLDAKRRPDGGFSAEKRYYRTGRTPGSGRSTVGWGVTGTSQSNPFVTVEALSVLAAAGRLGLQPGRRSSQESGRGGKRTAGQRSK